MILIFVKKILWFWSKTAKTFCLVTSFFMKCFVWITDRRWTQSRIPFHWIMYNICLLFWYKLVENYLFLNVNVLLLITDFRLAEYRIPYQQSLCKLCLWFISKTDRGSSYLLLSANVLSLITDYRRADPSILFHWSLCKFFLYFLSKTSIT